MKIKKIKVHTVQSQLTRHFKRN